MAATIQTIQKPTRARALDTSTSEQIIGEQLLEDPSFAVNVSAGATGDHWACDVVGNDGVSITGGKAVWADSGSDSVRRLQDNVSGPFSDVTARYRVTIVISDSTDGGVRLVSGSYYGSYLTAAGTYIIDMSPETGGGNFHIDGNADADLSISEVSTCFGPGAKAVISVACTVSLNKSLFIRFSSTGGSYPGVPGVPGASGST